MGTTRTLNRINQTSLRSAYYYGLVFLHAKLFGEERDGILLLLVGREKRRDDPKNGRISREGRVRDERRVQMRTHPPRVRSNEELRRAVGEGQTRHSRISNTRIRLARIRGGRKNPRIRRLARFSRRFDEAGKNQGRDRAGSLEVLQGRDGRRRSHVELQR